MCCPCHGESAANTSTQSAEVGSWSSLSELHLATCFIVAMSLVCCDSISGQLAPRVTSVSLLFRKTILRVRPSLDRLSCSVNPLQMMFFLTLCLRWPLLRTNRSHPLPSYRVTDVRLHWKEKTPMTMLVVRQMFSAFGLFVGLRCGLTEVTSPARHLPDSAPLQANNALPVQAAELPPPCFSALVLHPSPSTAFRSWLLYVSPAWLTPLALVGSPHGLCQGFS